MDNKNCFGGESWYNRTVIMGDGINPRLRLTYASRGDYIEKIVMLHKNDKWPSVDRMETLDRLYDFNTGTHMNLPPKYLEAFGPCPDCDFLKKNGSFYIGKDVIVKVVVVSNEGSFKNLKVFALYKKVK